MTAPAARRARQSVRDMALSLLLILLIVGFVLAFQHRGGKGVRVVDPSNTYAGARTAAHYPVLVPRLPATWRVTSATDQPTEGGHLTLRVGLLTPTGQYAQLVESDLPRNTLLHRELSAVRPLGSVPVRGAQWQQLAARKSGDRAIARTDGGVTYLVFGSAGLAELGVLAGSLRPAE